MNNLAVKELRNTTKVAPIKRVSRQMAKTSNIQTNPRIGIGQIHMSEVVDGMSKPQAPQMPPELLQKIRESLAVGLARSFINKALEEMQPPDMCNAEA